MEKFTDGNNRQDETNNEEATTSNAGVNDPIRETHNFNDLKTLDFNSADAVRQAMKALFENKNRLHCRNSGYRSMTKITNAKIVEETGHQHANISCEKNNFSISSNKNNHIAHGDKENKNNETSNAAVNDPNKEALNVNDLKLIEAIPTDDMRLNKDIIRHQDQKQCDDSERCKLTEEMDSNFVVKDDRKVQQQNGEKVIINVSKGNDPRDKDSNRDKKQRRKRPGRPPKPGPSKKRRKRKINQTTDIFYCGKLSNLIFMKKQYKHDASEDDSIFSF